MVFKVVFAFYFPVPVFTYRPSYRENKPKTFVFNHCKRAFWAFFSQKLGLSSGTDLFIILRLHLSPHKKKKPKFFLVTHISACNRSGNYLNIRLRVKMFIFRFKCNKFLTWPHFLPNDIRFCFRICGDIHDFIWAILIPWGVPKRVRTLHIPAPEVEPFYA